MAWLLDPRVSDQRELYWDDVYREDGSELAFKNWSRPEIIPPEESWPLPFRQVTNHKLVPDFISGRFGGTLFISQAFRELIEEFDPVQHHYIPLHLYLADGREAVGEYFLFKFGSFVDGIVAEKSEVGPMYNPAGKLGFYSTGHSPKVTWRADSIEGRHVWADRYLKKRFFCSDEFLAEVEKRKMKLFRKVESFVVWVSENAFCEAKEVL